MLCYLHISVQRYRVHLFYSIKLISSHVILDLSENTNVKRLTDNGANIEWSGKWQLYNNMWSAQRATHGGLLVALIKDSDCLHATCTEPRSVNQLWCCVVNLPHHKVILLHK